MRTAASTSRHRVAAPRAPSSFSMPGNLSQSNELINPRAKKSPRTRHGVRGDWSYLRATYLRLTRYVWLASVEPASGVAPSHEMLEMKVPSTYCAPLASTATADAA